MSEERHAPQERGGTEVNAFVKSRATEGVPRLRAVSGPGSGRAFAMVQQLATVGRHPTNDLVLDDPRVSGVHLELRRSGDRLHLRDAGSTNGTWLGAHRLTELELAPGGEILVGGTLLRLDHDQVPSAPLSKNDSFGELVGQSTVMREIFAALERVAPKDINLLIQGETGTGKEEIARATHARSPRAAFPFVTIEVTSVPESVAEVHLFGQEKGPSGEKRLGLFESANGGTVFIDEIGELPQWLQPKVLRVLEKGEVTRDGGLLPVRVDVRVIAATSRDLRHAIEAGRFREDLYFRLAPVRIVVPPLRDRAEDVPILCQKLLVEIAGARLSPLLVEQAAVQHLAAQPWPGNVRELKNVLARAAAVAQDDLIRRQDVAGEGIGFRGTREERTALDLSGTFSEAKDRAIARFEAAYLSALMRKCQGNLSLGSREADLARHHLRELLRKRGLYGLSWVDREPAGKAGDAEGTALPKEEAPREKG